MPCTCDSGGLLVSSRSSRPTVLGQFMGWSTEVCTYAPFSSLTHAPGVPVLRAHAAAPSILISAQCSGSPGQQHTVCNATHAGKVRDELRAGRGLLYQRQAWATTRSPSRSLLRAGAQGPRRDCGALKLCKRQIPSLLAKSDRPPALCPRCPCGAFLDPESVCRPAHFCPR